MSHLGEQEDLGGGLCHFICSNYLSKKQTNEDKFVLHIHWICVRWTWAKVYWSWIPYTDLAGGFCRHCKIFELRLSEKIHPTVCEYSSSQSSRTAPAQIRDRYLYNVWWHWRALFLLGPDFTFNQGHLDHACFYRVLEAIKAWRLPCQPSYSLQYLNQAHLPCFWWLRTAAYPHSAWNHSTTIYITEIIFTLMSSSVKILSPEGSCH